MAKKEVKNYRYEQDILDRIAEEERFRAEMASQVANSQASGGKMHVRPEDRERVQRMAAEREADFFRRNPQYKKKKK